MKSHKPFNINKPNKRRSQSVEPESGRFVEIFENNKNSKKTSITLIERASISGKFSAKTTGVLSQQSYNIRAMSYSTKIEYSFTSKRTLGEEIIARVEKWAGGAEEARRWYRAFPIPAFGDRTAESLVKAGEAEAVRDYLDAVATGAFA